MVDILNWKEKDSETQEGIKTDIIEKYKLGKCIRITRKDSLFKIQDWKIDDVKDIQEVGGGKRKTFFLKSTKVRKPMQVDKIWLERNTKIVDCK